MNDRRTIRLGYLRRHAAPLMTVGAVSVLGIVATAAFHAVTGRGLGPAAFGLLAAFLSIVNIAAIGASALQNAVAVATAQTRRDEAADLALVDGPAEPAGAAPDPAAPRTPRPPRPAPRHWDGALTEAFVLGGGGSAAVALLAPILATMLGTSRLAVYLAALTILPSFLFSVAQGRLQGVGRAVAVAGWSTTSQVLRVALAGGVLLVGLGAVSVLLAVLVAVVAVMALATWQVRGAHLRTRGTAFGRRTVVLILLTGSFAWLSNIDVVLVRAGTPEQAAGTYAAAAVLAKMILILPTTLSLYLLPRFVVRRGDSGTTRFGVNVVLLTVGGAGLAAAGAMTLLGGLLVGVFFGSGFDGAVGLLPALSLAYLPWALAQGLLIRLTAAESRHALVVLVVAAVAQWALARWVLPDLGAMIAVTGGLGVAVAVIFFVLHSRHHEPEVRLL
jgi:O-antigen/teichoic acid export membrane protein